jgi:hypothetical protein
MPKPLASAMLALMSAENFAFMPHTFGADPKAGHASVIAATKAILSRAA